jgi:hypothetical protein
MIQLDNQTAWSAGLYPGWTRDGKRQHTLIFKISHQFSSDGTLSLLPSIPIIEADCYRQIPQSSSLSAVNELAPFKQGGEVYLYGSAQPYGKNGTTLQVILGLCRGNNHFWTKELRVFGERLWQRKLFGHLPSHPEVISHAVPLIYEHAYGGSDPAHPEQVYTENPSGVGYSLRGLRTKGLRLPRIEQGPDFISSPASRVKPAGYGPLPPFWSPRHEEMGTIDSNAVAFGGCPWQSPQPATLHNVAPQDQRFDTPFEGELVIKLTGLVPDSPREVLIHLPQQHPAVSWEDSSLPPIKAPCFDTLVIDTDQRQIHQLWRTAVILESDREAQGWITLRDLQEDTSQATPLTSTMENVS